MLGHGTLIADGISRTTDDRTKIHQRLRVSRHIRSGRGEPALGFFPEESLKGGALPRRIGARHPRKHTFHIAIQNRNALLKYSGCNRCSGRSANTRQALKRLRGLWKLAVKIMLNCARTGQKISATLIVAKPRP